MSEFAIITIILAAILPLVVVICVILHSNQKLVERMAAMSVARDTRDLERVFNGPPPPKSAPSKADRLSLDMS